MFSSLSILPNRGRYKLLNINTDDADADAESVDIEYSAEHKQRTAKSILVKVLGAVAIMYATFSGLRALSRASFGKGWMSCHGAHRNLSNLTALPWHYQLPSGDRIPSIALGMGLVITNAHSGDIHK